jgi:hypothetical protein
VWPKRKGAVVPKLNQPMSEEEEAWNAARARLLQEPLSQSGLSAEAAERLRHMSYREFEALYFAGGGAAEKSFSVGLPDIYVGHVGLIEVDSHGTPYIIEAVPIARLKGTVIRSPYADWLRQHSGMQVWHGRARDVPEDLGRRLIVQAMKQLGKPYEFFNFDLNDDSGFYCSKLAWMSVWRATASGSSSTPIALDDNPNPRRPFFNWFTPKQLANSRHITLLHKPDEY